MVTSYNGYLASPNPADFGGLDNQVVPGTNVKLAPGVRRGEVAFIAFFTAWFWNKYIERLVSPGCWGFAYRQNRNANNLSNHSSATGWDINAPQHPNGVRGTLRGASLVPGKTKEQMLRQLLAFLEGTVRSGIDYTGTPDEMHLEVMDRITIARLAQIVQKIIRTYGNIDQWAGGAVLPDQPDKVSPVFTDQPVASKWHKINMGDVTDLMASGEQVARDQADLIDSGFTVGSGGADGFAGEDTINAIRSLQGALGIKVDGAMGPQTRDAVHKIPSFGLPAGHYYGDVKGPAESHGGINANERAKVDALQDQLIRKGHVGAQRDPNRTTWDDGVFTGPTVEAVKRFQRAEGLGVDGKVGPVTWTRLFR